MSVQRPHLLAFPRGDAGRGPGPGSFKGAARGAGGDPGGTGGQGSPLVDHHTHARLEAAGIGGAASGIFRVWVQVKRGSLWKP